ncbi:MAG: hypothetical protein AB7T01_02035 [Acidithiobacillus sp.]
MEFRNVVKEWLNVIPMEWLEDHARSQACDQQTMDEIRVLAAQGYRRAVLFMAHFCDSQLPEKG